VKDMTDQTIGHLIDIRRYPVKSMLGERVSSVSVDGRGLTGDRICAFRDMATGKIASAKLPHRWRRLLSCAASYDEANDRIEIRLPDGACDTPAALAGALSDLLGRQVEPIFARPEGLLIDRVGLEEVGSHGSASDSVQTVTFQVGFGAPEGGFFDAMPVHFITTASLAEVAKRTADGHVEVERFRPNLVIEGDLAAFSENDWEDAILSIGGVDLAVICPTPRCAVPALAHGEAPENMKLPRLLAELNRAEVPTLGRVACLGGYGRVIRAGVLNRGDRVVLRR